MRRHLLSFAAVLTSAALVGCQGKQTLYVVADTSEPIEIDVGGKAMPSPVTEFQAFSRLKLTKGATLVATKGGQEIDRVELGPVQEGDSAIYVVKASDRIKLVDLSPLAGVGRTKDRGVAGPLKASEVTLFGGDTTPKTITLDERSVVVGPSAAVPAGGQVTLGMEKLPIVRAERIPDHVTDARVFVAAKLSKELGYDRLPGTAR
ncbi:MAG: hypothetical protein IPG50_17225 [Myxococcales bacterium]|nr:hypothetical protein [Myxococcales bacterium]